MRLRFWGLVAVFCTVAVCFGYGRLFFVGSNPQLSVIAYPQDVLLLNKDYISFQISYQSLPWWGDLDEPMNKPNDSYTSTEENINFVKDDNDTQNSYFKQYNSISSVKNRLNYFHKWEEKLSGLFTLSYDYNAMTGEASGNLRSLETGTPVYVPFSYSVSHPFHNYYLQGIFGFEFAGLPVGLKLGFGQDISMEPVHSFSFKTGGVDYSSKRLVWGWSTAACSHIFGVKNINGDAWFQNQYSIGPLSKLDVQLGTTFAFGKFGARFRYSSGIQEQYAWVAETTNTTLNANFKGDYQKQTWAKKTDDFLYRIYGNIFWDKTENYSINTLFFLGLDSYTSHNALLENLQVQNNSRQTYSSIVVEANPNVNIYLGPNFVFDAAILLEYVHTGYENLYDHWNPLIGGSKSAYWSTTAYRGDEYWWENYSYAQENFFDAGLDVNLTIPLYGDASQSLGLGLNLFVNSKFTAISKYYGDNQNTTTDVVFNEVDVRDTFKREIWFNSVLMLIYRNDRITYRLELVEPLIYSLLSHTKVLDAKRSTLYYENEKNRNWAVQEGLLISLTVSYEL